MKSEEEPAPAAVREFSTPLFPDAALLGSLGDISGWTPAEKQEIVSAAAEIVAEGKDGDERRYRRRC